MALAAFEFGLISWLGESGTLAVAAAGGVGLAGAAASVAKSPTY